MLWRRIIPQPHFYQQPSGIPKAKLPGLKWMQCYAIRYLGETQAGTTPWMTVNRGMSPDYPRSLTIIASEFQAVSRELPSD